jgi:hypothetical protein
MKKLGALLGKTTVQTKNLMSTTKQASKNAVSTTKSTIANAKADFVAGYKEQAEKPEPIQVPEI